ncbi:hypothetical protein KJY73_12920 [Bowmanella sp. Y26]|uniref:hypothetical protein n=1 Tax=Bowmanella yangjiangensis TaxID=2811230 RepID=UPI001BDC0356|nr:hypothetical protein [Bowmanella yangjiangensis]MBT1064484.1 hypothetical protein [Bowmanella yangjiangensis]
MQLTHCIQWKTADCHDRALKFIPHYWDVRATEIEIRRGENLTQSAAASLAKKAFKEKVLVYKTDGKFAGATSKFTGFHYVILLATGGDLKGRGFCVVFDPDVSATEKSREAWASCSKDADLDATKADERILKRMILGEGKDLGPLVRYFYGP